MITKNFLYLIKASFFQFIWIAILISFLLFFLNTLFATSFGIENFGSDVKNKLWVYFYIQDIDENSDYISSKIVNLSSELESGWLNVEYYSKSDALGLIENKIPEIIATFETYWIENPLPPTLYVLFENNEEYEFMKNTVASYEEIIINIEDVIQWQSFDDQKERIANIINLTNFIVIFSYFLISVLLIIIITFLMYVIKSSFYTFYNQIEVAKLLWAQYFQIKFPFFIKMFFILLFWKVFMMWYMYFLANYLDTYLYNLFTFSFIEYISAYYEDIIYIISIQFVIVLFFSILISNFFLNRLIKKI